MSGIWQEIGDRVWVRRDEPLDRTIGAIGGSLGLWSSTHEPATASPVSFSGAR